MKKLKVTFIAASILAIGSAFTPKATAALARPTDVAALSLLTCASITCQNTGAIHCGYAVNKCGVQFINKSN